MKRAEQYRFIKALRPFSLVVALVAAGLGVLLAWKDGYQNAWHGILVVTGALCAQAGVNLINDVEDLPLLPPDASAVRASIHYNARIAVALFLCALILGGYFTWLQGWIVMAMVLIVAALALCYNLGPINFKSRGLALIQVFFLMGVCLVEGAYLAMAGHFTAEVFYLSLPISILVSLLLLSNELRDWQTDSSQNVKTLTVRIGYPGAVTLYASLVVFAYLLAFLILWIRHNNLWWLLLVPLPVLLPIAHHLRATDRTALTPLTGRFFLLFGLAWMVALSQ